MLQDFLLSSRKDLMNLLDALGTRFPYDADRETLAWIAANSIGNKKNAKKARNGISIVSVCRITFAVSVISLVALVAFYVLARGLRGGIIFCDRGMSGRRCIRCPSNAVCYNGSAHCADGYIFVGKLCVPDDKDAVKVSEMMSNAMRYCSKRAGDYHCQLVGYDFVSLDELDSYLFHISKLREEEFEDVFFKTTSQLRNETSILFKIIDGKEVVISSDVKKDFRCSIKHFLYSKIYVLVGFGAAFLISVFAFIYYGNYKRNNKQAKYYFNSLLMYLKNSKSSQSKENLKRELNVISHNKSNKLWNNIEKILSKSPNIQKFNNNGNVVYRYKSFK